MPKDTDIAIEVKDICKAYRIWRDPAARLKFPLLQALGSVVPTALQPHALRRRVGEVHQTPYYKDFDALQDINFSVRKGEALGIIGCNGSGKSTLLQIIAGTLTPSSGKVSVQGRLAALLELGSGFNPDFTGRENVHLNASILGLSSREIDACYKDIAAFADIGEFIEQPVKTYSSGMMVRLAFAVQCAVQPDILVVDEALAVGDALFQKRCFERIATLIARGTTLLFVSHDEESVRTLTSRAILLQHGRIACIGPSAEVLLEYRRQLHEQEKTYLGQATRKLAERAGAITPLQVKDGPAIKRSFGDLEAEILGVEVLNSAGEPQSAFHPTDIIRVRVSAVAYQEISGINVALRIRNKQGFKLYSWGTLNQDCSILAGLRQGEVFWQRRFAANEHFQVEFTWTCGLGTNLYEVQAALTWEGKPYYSEQRTLHWRDEAAFFNVTQEIPSYHFGGAADLRMRASWPSL
jgi:lipopolysaccharide transport system ATP-binding protein